MVALGTFARLEAGLAAAEERHTCNAVVTFTTAAAGAVHGVPVQADLWHVAPDQYGAMVASPQLRVLRERVPQLAEGDSVTVGSGSSAWLVRRVDADGPGLWLTVLLAED